MKPGRSGPLASTPRPSSTTEPIHLVTGTILPIWDRIAGHPRIYRAQTDAGERMIGRAVMPEHLSATLKALGAAGDRVDITPEALAERLTGRRRGRSREWLAAPRAARGERAPDRTRGAGPGRHARAGGRRGLRRGPRLPHPVLRPDGRAGGGRPSGGHRAPACRGGAGSVRHRIGHRICWSVPSA